MRQWLAAMAEAGRIVSDRPQLWVPGALAWLVTVGWLPLLIAVIRLPPVSELTFLGAGFFVSGAWPWNAIGIVTAALGVGALAFGLSATAEAVLLAMPAGGTVGTRDVWRLFAIGIVAAMPALLTLFVLGISVVVVAPAEFNQPGGTGPIARTLVRLAPVLVVLGVTIVLASAVAAAGGREALRTRASVGRALAAGVRRLVRVGLPSLAQALLAVALRVAFVAFAALLLGVLWAPIGERLDRGEMGPGELLLLVGFVAIWLCLVLGGGALHAWSSLTWSGVLVVPDPATEPSAHRSVSP